MWGRVGLYVARDFQGASEQSWKVLAMEPKFGAAQYTLGLAYAQMGLTEDAIVELRNARTCAGDQPAVLAALAHVYACAGESSEAAGMLGELENLSQRRYVSPYWLAWSIPAWEIARARWNCWTGRMRNATSG
jgi:Flp pilus assembly protein TadD